MFAQEIGTEKGIRISAERDPVRPIMDSVSITAKVPVLDTIQIDTVENDSLKPQFLTDIVTYTAEDYMRLSPQENKMYLYNHAEITYGDINLTAGLIIINNEKNEVYAFGIPDSTGTYSQT
ncbi:MAG TPA: LPS-assembly protein LptD, partial [Salinimicrobium sp.]|nr:LPS-assembly protein LptD [Salinimicrobium sp.]